MVKFVAIHESNSRQCKFGSTGTTTVVSTIKCTMNVVPPNFNGKKRAILIGINYTGQEGAMTSCHDDVSRIQEYLIEREDFDANDISLY